MNPAKVFIKKRTRENKISLPYIEVLWEAGKKKKKNKQVNLKWHLKKIAVW